MSNPGIQFTPPGIAKILDLCPPDPQDFFAYFLRHTTTQVQYLFHTRASVNHAIRHAIIVDHVQDVELLTHLAMTYGEFRETADFSTMVENR